MLMPASAQIPHHTVRPVASYLVLHRRRRHNSDRRFRLQGPTRKVVFCTRSVLGSSNGAPSGGLVKKRKIVEHIILLRAKPNISDAEEKDMLDYLYTSQYQMRGILAVSLGRIEDPNTENFTHAVLMRFQQKADIAKFQSSPYYYKILDEHVKPVSYGSVSVDFESEVEDDIIPLFRRGEDFNHGVEFMLLISFLESASGDSVEDALASLQRFISQCSSFIVQATLGCCLNHMDSGYSHAAVIRFPSFDDFKLFREGMKYKDMWALTFQPIVEKSLERRDRSISCVVGLGSPAPPAWTQTHHDPPPLESCACCCSNGRAPPPSPPSKGRSPYSAATATATPLLSSGLSGGHGGCLPALLPGE